MAVAHWQNVDKSIDKMCAAGYLSEKHEPTPAKNFYV